MTLARISDVAKDPTPRGCEECAARLFYQTPVYRVWNGQGDSNHRYMLSIDLRDQMVARGFFAEGYGANAVATCVGGEV
jgi:hypothetical protein